MTDEYEAGRRNGRTEASLESIAGALDGLRGEMRTRMADLQCMQHARAIEALRVQIHVGAAILVVLVGILIKLLLE